MTEPRAIFLDAGGTLIHLDRELVRRRLGEHGLRCDDAVLAEAQGAASKRVSTHARSGVALDDATRWAIHLAALFDRLGCTREVAVAVERALRADHAEGRLWGRVEAGTREALDALRRRGHVLGVVSNADGSVEDLLEIAGLRERVDFVVDSEVVGVEKPDPRIFDIARERAGVAADEALHVGDLYDVDVVGARRAGIEAVLVDPRPGPVVSRSVSRIRAVAELPSWIESASAHDAERGVRT